MQQQEEQMFSWHAVDIQKAQLLSFRGQIVHILEHVTYSNVFFKYTKKMTNCIIVHFSSSLSAHTEMIIIFIVRYKGMAALLHLIL